MPSNSIFDKVLSPIETYGQRIGALICEAPSDITTEQLHVSGQTLVVFARLANGELVQSNNFRTSDNRPKPGDPTFFPGLASQ